MHIVLLSGGSGQRLWPLSNDVRSKQFIRLFSQANGQHISMVQRVYRQIRRTIPFAHVTVATARNQVSVLRNQLDDSVDICVEPCRRDTFPAIALASAYLHDVRHVGADEAIAVCPVDPYVDDTYFHTVKRLTEIADGGTYRLMLMGIEPTYPSEKYGYIIPQDEQEISRVLSFKEKPDVCTARNYIALKALWNSGVFSYRLSYVLAKATELFGFCRYHDLIKQYRDLKRISFDYAVAEREQEIGVLRYQGIWKDLGTWNTLTEVMGQNIGNVIMGDGCLNVHTINELDMPLLCMGLQDIVIAASPNGILVSDKKASSYIKPYVERLSSQVMVAEKSWGEFRIIDVEEESMVIKVLLNPGHGMSYHSHVHRDEIWNIVAGEGEAVLDGKTHFVKTGDQVRIPRGVKHTLRAVTSLRMIEIQIGQDISVDDKVKYLE